MQIKEIEIELRKGLYGNAHKSPAVEMWFLLAEIAALTAENKRLREVLERLARLGNEPMLGNSIGNKIAQAALKQRKEVGDEIQNCNR